jgi:hypothetical protein
MKPGDKVRYAAPDLDEEYKEYGDFEVVKCDCEECQSGLAVRVNLPSELSDSDTKHVLTSSLKQSIKIPTWTKHIQPQKIMATRKSGG